MQHKPRLQYVIIVLRPLFFRSLIMGAAQPFPIQFPMGAAKLCPVYDDLPVFPADTHAFKHPAAQQPAAQAMDDILQFFRIQPSQVPVDGFPVRKFVRRRLLPAKRPDIAYHCP